MKRTCAFIAALLVTVGILQAQFITNGEISQIIEAPPGYDRCGVTVFPDYDSRGDRKESPAFGTNGILAKPVGWSSLRGTPDFYLECFANPRVVPVVEDGVRGQLELPDLSPDGNEGGFIGMYVSNHYREYIQNKLDQPLLPGRRYRFKARVAVRENLWRPSTLQPHQYSLCAPRQISLLISEKRIVADGNGPYIQSDPALSFEIIDNNGHGNFDVNPGNVNGAERWENISYEFDIPVKMRNGVGFIALAPGPVNKYLWIDDVVGLPPNPTMEGWDSYIYIDGVEITELPCTCDDITMSLNQSAVAFPNDAFCCFAIDIENNSQCAVSKLTVETNADVAFIDGDAVQPGVRVFTEDLSTRDWTNGKTQSRTYCLLINGASVGGRAFVDVTLTLASGVVCKQTFTVNCTPCNCDVNTPRVRFQKLPPKLGQEGCCFKLVADNPSGCTDAKILSWGIAVNGESIDSDTQIKLDKSVGNIVSSEFCIPAGSTQKVFAMVKMDLNGTICEVLVEEELYCNCCATATVTASSPEPKELLPNPLAICLSCPPIAVRLNYTGQSLCSDDAAIIFPTKQTRTMKVPINQPAGTSYLLALVCPGDKPYTLKVMIGDCEYEVRIPACDGTATQDDPPSFGKQTHNGHDYGEATTYTLSISDVRGVRYGTRTGTNINQLCEQARSSELPNGFYVVYVHDAAGALVDRRFFIK